MLTRKFSFLAETIYNFIIIMKRNIIALLLSVFLFVGCSTSKTNEHTITVSVVPQKFFVNQIAGNWLNVNVMVPPGGSPATYEPTPMQMKALSNSLVYFRVGHITFEKAWMPKLESINPNMKVVDTSKGLSLISEEDFGVVHTDEKGHSHRHSGFNPHIWLSPDLVKKQSQTIFNELAEMYPDSALQMQKNLTRFTAQVDSVHLALNKQLNAAAGTGFIVYHPVWSYLARDYALNQVAIEHNGKEATANKMRKIVDFANENNIRIIFVQREFSAAQAKSVANEINGDVVVMNPLDYDWFKVMNEFGQAFEKL